MTEAKAQINGSDELGWALDQLLERSRDMKETFGLCPKAIARAHARLLRERAEIDRVAAELANEKRISAQARRRLGLGAAGSGGTMLKPSEIRITDIGTLLDTLGRVELEAVAALIVRWHQVNGHADWTPVSRTDVATLCVSDPVAREWSRNPFWRPDAYGFHERGFIDGWCEMPEAKGTLTQKFHDALEVRAQKDRERGQRTIT